MGNAGTSVRVFGGVGVDDVDGPVSIGGPRQRRLLALLVVRLEVVATNDWLAEYLWSDEDRPKATAPAIRTYVSRLRQALPAEARDWVETESSGYRWVGPVDVVEHRRFALLRSAATQARKSEDPQTALSLLDEALDLWRGDPFRELEDLDWARADIEQLGLDRLEMQEERWEAGLALGRHTQITGELAAFTAEHRLRDRSARQYALALHRSGRTTEALRVIAAHRETLAEESGLDPSPGVIELEAALLAGDASLDVEKVGRPLRGYRLLEEIGTGAFSVVWRGIQPSVDREVAVKQIRSDLASQPEFIRRFEAEAHLIARIEHPYIVPLIDYWRDPDSAYLVMRWLRGGTLERALDDGPLTVAQTMSVARQIGGALSAAHAQGVVHRDVKTSNILCDEQQNAFLADFGIALEAAESSGPEAALSPGSPAYASPEQIRQERLDAPADLFSLGVVLYECLAGELPFPGSSSVAELVELQLTTPYPDLAELRSDVPAAMSAAIAKATAKDPADRYASVDEFLDALDTDSPAEAAGAVTVVDAANPYKGLLAFDSGDTARFFGRERLVTELTDRLDGTGVSSRCLVIVGPSGSGKSSVARAGLVPAIRTGAIAGSDDWFVTTMTPATDPYEALEAALLRIAVNPPPSLIEQLRSGPRGIVRGLRRCLTSDNDQVLVVVDQFEELFTNATAQDADEFLAALSVAVEDPTSPLRLVATLRADFYDRPLEHPTFAQIVKQTTVQVTPLAADELERAIVEPARQLGVGFEPGLVARIAAETTGQPSPLPLLQFTLSALFDRREGRQLTIAAYEEIGGLTGALAARAESIYLEADDTKRAAIRRVLGRMTNPQAESADLRRRVPLTDLDDNPTASWVVEAYGTARLLSFDRDDATREPTIEVAHEALLREWPRLVQWLADDLEVLRSADAVATAASAWEQGGRSPGDLYRGGRLENAVDLALSAPDRLRPIDNEFIDSSRSAAEADRRTEQHRVRRLRRLVAGVGVALVLALIAGAVAFRQQQRADDEAAAARLSADVAEAETRRAEQEAEAANVARLVSQSAAQSDEDPILSVLLALESHRRSPNPETEQAVLNAIGSSTILNRVVSHAPLNVETATDCDGHETHINSLGTEEFGVANGQLVSRDLLTGAVREHGPAPAECVSWMADEQRDRRWVGTVDGLRMWFGPYDGPWEVELEFGLPTLLLSRSFTAANNLAFVSFGSKDFLVLLDDRTGERVGTPFSPEDAAGRALVSADGSLIAMGFAAREESVFLGQTFVVDGHTGEELFRITDTAPDIPPAYGFDAAAGQFIVGFGDGSVSTIDVATGDVVSSVETTATSPFAEIGVRADGLIVAVSAGQIELVDRLTGPISSAVDVRNVGRARIRPDGTVLTGTFDERVEIFDLDGSSLLEQAFDVEPFATTEFNDGRIGLIQAQSASPEIIDLETGERTTFDLRTPEGDLYKPLVVWPEPGGLSAIDSTTWTRWQGEQMVERIDLGGETVTTGRFEDFVTVMMELGPDDSVAYTGGSRMIQLLHIEDGTTSTDSTIGAIGTLHEHPSLGGGFHVLDSDGVLRTYDSAGIELGEISIGSENVGEMSVDPATGKVAVAGVVGVSIVDTASGQIEFLPGTGNAARVSFARNGELLAIIGLDGTVRLWDLERRAPAGLIWNGTGSASGAASWYDDTSNSLWVSSSGKVVRVSLEPERWVERACEIVGRDLTQDEWDRFVRGEQPRRSACT